MGERWSGGYEVVVGDFVNANGVSTTGDVATDGVEPGRTLNRPATQSCVNTKGVPDPVVFDAGSSAMAELLW